MNVYDCVCECVRCKWARTLLYVSGIASLLMFPEDESGESSQQEEEESEAGETDEQDPEDYSLTDEQLERRRLVLYFSLF